MFLNILVLVDGSPDAQEALSQANDLAESENPGLTVLAANAPPLHGCPKRCRDSRSCT